MREAGNENEEREREKKTLPGSCMYRRWCGDGFQGGRGVGGVGGWQAKSETDAFQRTRSIEKTFPREHIS